MNIVPAIDIKDGKCVRLLRGKVGTETIFSENPQEVAKKWESLGASLIHVVDLDGAFEGNPKNFEIIMRIISSVNCAVQIGGGIRTHNSAKVYLDAGACTIILGTAAFLDPGLLEILCNDFPGRIAVGIDIKEGKIAIRGWRDVVDLDTQHVLEEFQSKGVSKILNTNIDRDGTLEGINIAEINSFLSISPMPVIASGGIAKMEDLEKLASLNSNVLEGAILGRSIYTGSIDLKEAIERFS